MFMAYVSFRFINILEPHKRVNRSEQYTVRSLPVLTISGDKYLSPAEMQKDSHVRQNII